MSKRKSKRGEVRVEGWAQPASAFHYHYFVQTRSLCGKYDLMAEPKRSIPSGLDKHQICQDCWKAKNEMAR